MHSTGMLMLMLLAQGDRSLKSESGMRYKSPDKCRALPMCFHPSVAKQGVFGTSFYDG